MTEPQPLLIVGYGNPSRGDDALGPRLIDWLERDTSLPDGYDTLTDFQLQIEHALDLRGRRRVLFIDASLNAPAPCRLTPLAARRDPSYTSHALSPEALLDVYCQVCPEPPPTCQLLAVRGYRFELGEALSPQAEANAEAAKTLIRRLLRDAD
ncbi:MAG: hydrogenase maturation protease [gamma proteobacterium symbiont of Phacoides pectinatus]